MIIDVRAQVKVSDFVMRFAAAAVAVQEDSRLQCSLHVQQVDFAADIELIEFGNVARADDSARGLDCYDFELPDTIVTPGTAGAASPACDNAAINIAAMPFYDSFEEKASSIKDI